MNKSKALRMARVNERNNAIMERQFQRKLRKVFQSLKVITKAEYNFSIDWYEFVNGMKKAFDVNSKTVLINRIKQFSGLYNTELDDDIIQRVTRKFDKKYSKNIADKVKHIEETAKEQIQRIISEGEEKGLSYEEVRRNINSKIDGLSIVRARVIAVTETGNLTNEIDNGIATETGMKTKTWIHTGIGKNDRPNHVALNGKTIPIDDYFDLGNGIKALYPHDPSLPVGEVANCFCLIVYE